MEIFKMSGTFGQNFQHSRFLAWNFQNFLRLSILSDPGAVLTPIPDNSFSGTLKVNIDTCRHKLLKYRYVMSICIDTEKFSILTSLQVVEEKPCSHLRRYNFVAISSLFWRIRRLPSPHSIRDLWRNDLVNAATIECARSLKKKKKNT